MSFSWAAARSFLARADGLFRRGMTSLHTRGWRQSWARVQARFARVPRARRATLYLPGPAPFAPFEVPFSAVPRASIVIPVYGQLAHTLACLRALAAHPPMAALEVIVVDDASTDDTADAIVEVAGVHLVRRPANGGFIAACNDGASRARGEVLVFLNNDTVPQPGWLDALLSTFEAWPNAGLVGAQLLYPDGRLQEAGGVVFRDGHAWNYGRNQSPDDPRYSYLRDADYVSGAAIAIPRALFLQLGGFDTRYAPAYYEDTDLAFAVRARGRRVLYQPAARVVHDEGATSGTDTGTGPKANQIRNRLVFAAHRADALAHHGAAAVPTPASLHKHQRNVLVIDSATPAPDRDSASLRLVNLMRMLLAEGAHVVFWPADRAHAGPYTDALRAMGVETWTAPHAPGAAAWLATHGARFDVVLACRYYVAAEFLPLLRRHAPRARVVFDTVDLHHLREARAAGMAGDAVLERSAARTRVAELAVVAAADATLVVSDDEQRLLQGAVPGARVHVLSNLHHVAGPGLPYGARRDLVFVGGFRHPPNVDAVAWFVEQVFPSIRERLPDVVFHCIGADVPARIAALSRHAGVAVHGHVPDLAPYMAGCRVAVAPLRFGAGVKGKVNLSMAHGQPVVATTCAVEGMHLADGRDVLVADDAAAFGAAVVRLHDDPGLWNALAAAGLANVEAHFSVESARGTVRRVFLEPDG